ncbi:dihydroorotase [Atopobium sp. oral taxon 810]|uniref:dihydroorotase n=1 Tax=Atopobium sp. oral taxon 810 TaxID=712158 RepID=UPI0003969178|nr:dihydroorotase [Atopobium sp. oral taxon 810]ERI03799.1 putative dihydroorotase [Atopobium sp. oral taxon 810 str. F0209]
MAYLIRGARVVDPQLALDDVRDVLIEGNKIKAVGNNLEVANAEVVEAAGKVLIPGMVDMHVHFRDPGFEYKETIETGSRAAAHGGFTDVATMPNTSPVTDSGAEIRYQIDRGEAAGHVHIRPIGALTKDQKGEALAEIGDMVLEGACAFSDDGHGVQSAGMMKTCMGYVSQFNRVAIAHCEDESLSKNGVINAGRAATRLGMFGWPALAEEHEIWRDIQLTRSTNCALHIAHISTARGLEMVKAAKAEGLPVTCEVTPHHLFLCDDDITTAYNTNLKMNPPLRSAKDAEALRQGIVDGSIDCVVTDHAPHAAHEKDCEWEIAFFGIIGLETSLPLMLTHMVEPGIMSWSRLVEVMAVSPREILRLPAVKIEEGSVADLTLIDPEAQLEVTEDYFESKSKNSAFLGNKLKGAACDVFCGGKRTLANGVVA